MINGGHKTIDGPNGLHIKPFSIHWFATLSPIAIELLNAAQAIAFRNLKSSDFIESILDIYRNEVAFLDSDRILHDDIESSIAFLQNLSIDNEIL